MSSCRLPGRGSVLSRLRWAEPKPNGASIESADCRSSTRRNHPLLSVTHFFSLPVADEFQLAHTEIHISGESVAPRPVKIGSYGNLGASMTSMLPLKFVQPRSFYTPLAIFLSVTCSLHGQQI